jgi:hypothetical protein
MEINGKYDNHPNIFRKINIYINLDVSIWLSKVVKRLFINYKWNKFGLKFMKLY